MAEKSQAKGKKIAGMIKVEVPAGQAAPSQSLGPALGQRGLNIMEFCNAVNEATSDYEPGTPVPVTITAYEDRSFTFVTKTPPASYYLRKAAGIDKGSTRPGREAKGQVSRQQLSEIAEAKMKDLNAYNLEQAVRIIEGSARSMGLEVRES